MRRLISYPAAHAGIRQAVAVLFSRRSRDAYVRQAIQVRQTYTFDAARGQPTTWLKGEYAYLAPNAASALLARCNLKHDWIEEDELDAEAAAAYRLIVVPNAGHLAERTVERLTNWLHTTDGRLLATGKTNLPPALLGLRRSVALTPPGYSGWRWLAGTAFGDRRAWQECYVTGYAGHAVNQLEVAEHARVLAELVEFGGDLSTAATADKRVLGPAVVTTEQTVYVANQVLEFLGGMLQGHLNVEAVRHWANPSHWGDTIGLFLRRLLLEIGLESLWDTRLRAFGPHAGAFSLRHDVHGMLDFSFLDYQAQNLIPATYDIEDPAISANITIEQAQAWITRVSEFEFLEAALHNDSQWGDPPVAVYGTGLFDHVRSARQHLGFPIHTAGRHAGGHMHPETLDAMDYLYEHDPEILGLCTFCYYHMIEYGVRTPGVAASGQIGGKPLTYITNARRTISTQGFWFPFHPVVTTDQSWRVLRGWDRTHEFDAAPELVETILGGHSARVPNAEDQLENGVYSFQYHPELANDPAQNAGRGTLPYLRYAIILAERRNLWIASQRELYQRMADYQDLRMRVVDDQQLRIVNPSPRHIVEMVVEQRLAFGSVWDGESELIGVCGERFVLLPPLAPGEERTLRFSARVSTAPRVTQAGARGLKVLDARHEALTGETRVLVSVCREQHLRLDNVALDGLYA
ncbi:MAG: hypothetical protein LC797_17210, partial [Chloroflexi bacterium]|nr:hypothetical protein [Chloroflexota bacterium]